MVSETLRRDDKELYTQSNDRRFSLALDSTSIASPPDDVRKRSRKVRNSHLRSLGMRQQPKEAGFLLNAELPSPKKRHPHEDVSDEDLADAPDLSGQDAARGQRFANIFLNTAINFQAKYNVVGIPETRIKADPSKYFSQKKVRVSRASRNRAELVKAAFEVRYHCLNLALEYGDSADEHLGVVGVYNPLQVIRNRTVKLKLGHPNPPAYRTLPLACNAFSSHSTGGKIWSMHWGINLNDLIYDFGWRQVHWNKLVNPKGELWFPDQNSRKEQLNDSSSNLYDKLWVDKDSDNLLRAEDILLEVPTTFPQLKTTKARQIRSNLKLKAKKFYGNSSGNESLLDQDLTDNNSFYINKLSSLEGLSKLKIDRVGRHISVDSSSQEKPYLSSKKGGSDAALSTLDNEGEPEEEMPKNVLKIMVTDPESSQIQNFNSNKILPKKASPQKSEELPNMNSSKTEGTAISEVSFSQINLHSKESKSSDQETASSRDESPIPEEETLAKPAEAIETPADCFGLINKEISFLKAVSFVSAYHLGTIYPRVLELAESKTVDIHENMILGLLKSAIRINEEYLTEQEGLFRAYLDETNTLIHLANDRHAVRIDNLLNTADRSYNELNTSLMMDLRKVSELIDRLDSKFFGSTVTTVLTDSRNTVLSGELHQTLYFILETVIVIVLRIVWILATILKGLLLFANGFYLLFSKILAAFC